MNKLKFEVLNTVKSVKFTKNFGSWDLTQKICPWGLGLDDF